MNNEIFTFESVSRLLKNYNLLMRKSKQLAFEIESAEPIASETDLIDSMTFSKAFVDGLGFSKTRRPSDKTSNIAASYKERMDEINMKHREELLKELTLTLTDMNRIEYYISLLVERQAKILRLLYIEGYSYAEAAKEMGISIKAVTNSRRAGIESLVDMFNLIAN